MVQPIFRVSSLGEKKSNRKTPTDRTDQLRAYAAALHFPVPEMPITTTLLLNSLKDERNDEAWTDFDARYRRVIEDFAKSAGLRDDDASEVAQQTLFEFVKAYRLGRYNRERGRLHSWIIGIAQNKVADVFRQRPRAAPGVGGSRSDSGTTGGSGGGGQRGEVGEEREGSQGSEGGDYR